MGELPCITEQVTTHLPWKTSALTLEQPHKPEPLFHSTHILVKNSNANAPKLLLIPRRVAAVVVHAPIVEGRGFPIPLGILSFDSAIVRRVHRYLADHLPAEVTKYGSTDRFNIRGCLEWAQDADAEARGWTSLDQAQGKGPKEGGPGTGAGPATPAPRRQAARAGARRSQPGPRR